MIENVFFCERSKKFVKHFAKKKFQGVLRHQWDAPKHPKTFFWQNHL